MSAWEPFEFDDGEIVLLFETPEAWQRWLAEAYPEREDQPWRKGYLRRLWAVCLCNYATEVGVEPPRFGLDRSKYHHTPALADWAARREISL